MAIREEIFKPAKIPNFGADPKIFNRQVMDSINQTNNHIRNLRDRIRTLEEVKPESFRHITNKFQKERTTANPSKEVVFKSSDSTLSINIGEDEVDFNVKAFKGPVEEQYLLRDGSRDLTDDWDAGSYEIRSNSFSVESNILMDNLAWHGVDANGGRIVFVKNV
jgi:hypothetical protein